MSTLSRGGGSRANTYVALLLPLGILFRRQSPGLGHTGRELGALALTRLERLAGLVAVLLEAAPQLLEPALQLPMDHHHGLVHTLEIAAVCVGQLSQELLQGSAVRKNVLNSNI